MQGEVKRRLLLPAQPTVRLDTSLELLLERWPSSSAARVLATLVATAGSTYRKPGARMLIMDDGSFFGLLSGGCLEADLKLHALDVMQRSLARAVEYDMRGPDDVLFGLGAGCEGAMRVLLEPAGPGTRAAAAIAAAATAIKDGDATSLVLVHEGEDVPLGTYHELESLPSNLRLAAAQSRAETASRAIEWQGRAGRARAFAQYLAPVPHLLICGAGPDAQPVVSAARGLGWRLTVLDHRPAYASAERFPGARVLLCDPARLQEQVELATCDAAVVMSHHLLSDTHYLRALAEVASLGYIGLLGPAARRQRIACDLGAAYDRLGERIRGPVGIDIGATTPEAIALAIVSEIHAWLAMRLP